MCRNKNTAALIKHAPELIEQQGIPSGEPWKVAELPCSKGRETWSIAAGLAIQGIDFTIVGYDINPHVLKMAQQPIPDMWRGKDTLAEDFVKWGLPKECADFFEVDGTDAQPNKELQAHVQFAQLDARHESPAVNDVVVANNFLHYVQTIKSFPHTIGNIVSSLSNNGVLTVSPTSSRIHDALIGGGLTPDEGLLGSESASRLPEFYRRNQQSQRQLDGRRPSGR